MVIIKGKLIAYSSTKCDSLEDEITRLIVDFGDNQFHGLLFYGEIWFSEYIKGLDIEFKQTTVGCGPFKKVVQYITGDGFGSMIRKKPSHIRQLCYETDTEYCIDWIRKIPHYLNDKQA